MKKRIILTAVLLLAAVSSAGAAELTLAECIETAVKNHPDLAVSEARVDSAKAGISQAKAGAQPQVDLNGSYTRGNSPLEDETTRGNYNTGVTLSQLITDSGKTKLRIKKAQQTTDASKEDLAEKRNEIVRSVSDAYYSLNSTVRGCEVAQTRYDNYAKRLDWANAYYKAGKKPKIEVTRAEADLASAKLALITSKTDVQVARAELASAMGDAQLKIESVRDELEYEDWNISEDEAIKTALAARPELIAKAKRVEAVKSELGIQQKGMSPTVSLGGGYTLSGSAPADDKDWNARLTLSLPLTDGGATNSRIAQARADLKAAEAEQKSLQNAVVLEVRTAWQSMIKAKESIVSAKEAERKEKENHELAAKRYEAGVGNSLEISDAVDSYALSQAKTILALYGGKSSQLTLLKAIGGKR